MANELVMLATDWDPSEDPTGMWMSEKLDGVLALWDGKGFLTRQGNSLAAPEWFTRHFPQDRLLGELFLGRGKFSETLGIVRRARPRDLDWTRVTYQAFDVPDVNASFESRLIGMINTRHSLVSAWKGDRSRPAFTAGMALPFRIVNHVPCQSREHADGFHRDIVSKGGEGTMFRRRGSQYHVGRSRDVLRRKDWITEEAWVIGHNYGDAGLRSLRCELVSDPSIKFDVGSGLSMGDIIAPPAEGTIVTVRYKARTDGSTLREPSFVCTRDYE